MTYNETLEFIYSQLPMFHREGVSAYNPKLDKVMKFSAALGNKHSQFKTIHIAGTNGKGSTSHMLAAVLQNAGYKTGLFTSPHLLDFRERIRVNGIMVSEDFVVQFINDNKLLIQELAPSFFEMTTLMAFEYFALENVQIAIIETGLGGRLDATNIISPILSIITNISLDHCDILGNSIVQIAFEKSGIIKPKTPVLIGETDSETVALFTSRAKAEGATIVFADEVAHAEIVASQSANYQRFKILSNDFELNHCEYSIDLLGNYQSKNICTALVAIKMLKELNIEISDDNVKYGLLNVSSLTGFSGRWQIIGSSPLIIADTGHNESGLQNTMLQLNSLKKSELHFVLGFVKEKDIKSILRLLPKDANYYFTNANIPRALNANELFGLALNEGLHGNVYSSVKEAVNAAKQNANSSDVIFIGGSTFVVSEALVV